MALPAIEVPAHVADQRGYNITRGIAGEFITAKTKINSTPNVFVTKNAIMSIKSIRNTLRTDIDNGHIDQSPARKASVQLCLDELDAFILAVAPLGPYYNKIVGQAMFDRNNAGDEVTEAQVQIETNLTVNHKNQLITRIDAVLGI